MQPMGEMAIPQLEKQKELEGVGAVQSEEMSEIIMDIAEITA